MNDSTRLTDVLTALIEAGAQVPDLVSPYPLGKPAFGPPATPQAIRDLETLLGAPLPSDYRYFLQRCDSINAMDLVNGYHVYAPILVCRLFTAHEVPTTLLLDTGTTLAIPVAGDGGGNQFLLAVTGDALWKWSRACRPDGHGAINATEPHRGLALVAPNFTTFLTRVLDDWRHFLNDDRSWKYLSG